MVLSCREGSAEEQSPAQGRPRGSQRAVVQGSDQRRMVGLGHVGVAERELGHGHVEGVLAPEIAGDDRGVASARVGPREHPAAHLPVHGQRVGIQEVGVDGALHVA